MRKILITAFVIIAIFSAAVSAQDNIEKKKIEFLIASIQDLKGAKFIRNGAEYDGLEAAKHLRLKLEKAGKHVRTADDFIKLCASKSYMTGKPYMIKFPDGKIISSEKYLRGKIKEYSSTGKN
ncbi:MAG: hypothetical protein CVU62_03760 [Deltaproteobacteria bacterium HGW-Deltaproteobacteria-2]|jgi:hypothetical protein|nr:MAG: hypothetical protein CVU62_03760 [Deltaproteobacteria bacterium HGW-Deltaproteobacteria-2]